MVAAADSGGNGVMKCPACKAELLEVVNCERYSEPRTRGFFCIVCLIFYDFWEEQAIENKK